MRTLIFLSLALCAAPALAQPEANPATNQPTRVRPADTKSQIKQDLQDFAREWNNRNPKNAASVSLFEGNSPARIFGSRQGYFGARAWFRTIAPIFNRVKLIVKDVKALEFKGNEAKAVVSYTFEILDRNEDETKLPAQWQSERHEELRFHRVIKDGADFEGQISVGEFAVGESLWQIVPPQNSPGELTTKLDAPQNSNFWNIVAYHAAQKQLPKLVGSAAEHSLHNLRDVGLAALQLSQDYNQDGYDCFAFAPRYMIEALMPYLSDPNSLRVPDTNEIYSFNDNLSGFKTDKVKAPARTVLFYEGQNEKPIFRYDGKAAICFADGHVALVSPDEAQKLIWKP